MTSFFDSIKEGAVTGKAWLVCLAVALLCGTITAISAAYRSDTSKSFLCALTVLPVIVQTVITMVNGNIGTGVAVMGAFSLVRFRSVPGKARDIVLIFLAMTAGLTCAAGYIGIAFLLTVFVGLIIALSVHIPFCDRMLDLRITVPETLNFVSAFDDIFEKYTSSCCLISTKTCNMGSLYKLTYKISLKRKTDLRSLIDELRTRNGNLEVFVCEASEGSDSL